MDWQACCSAEGKPAMKQSLTMIDTRSLGASLMGRLAARRLGNRGGQMRHRPSIHMFSRALYAVSLAGLTITNRPAEAVTFHSTPPVAVSDVSPFSTCTADALPENPIVLDQEGEPYVVVNPDDPDHIVGTW